MSVQLVVENLTKNFSGTVAVDNISFTANQGEVVGFLGPNGAGKSTTMRMITGFLYPSNGRALINGIDILKNPKKAKIRAPLLEAGQFIIVSIYLVHQSNRVERHHREFF